MKQSEKTFWMRKLEKKQRKRRIFRVHNTLFSVIERDFNCEMSRKGQWRKKHKESRREGVINRFPSVESENQQLSPLYLFADLQISVGAYVTINIIIFFFCVSVFFPDYKLLKAGNTSLIIYMSSTFSNVLGITGSQVLYEQNYKFGKFKNLYFLEKTLNCLSHTAEISWASLVIQMIMEAA